MTDHLDRLRLFAYAEGANDVDRVAVAAHLGTCTSCRAALYEMQQSLLLLGDGSVLGFLADSESDTERFDLRARLETLAAEETAADVAAEQILASFLLRPADGWDAAAVAEPAYRSVPFLRRLLRVGERELDRRPRQALALIDFAARWARGDDSAAHQLLGDIWKHRANALRHLGRYSEALDAAEIGETFFSSVPNAEFDVGQARYATAVVLIKMNRYAEALEVLGAAEAILAPFGDTLPLAKAAVLRAGILFQQGDVDEAEKRWCAAIPILEQLGDRVELARVRANLAECHRAAGRYDDALRDAAHAIAAYRALEMDAERIRAEWTVANIQLNCDEAETGMAGLEEAAEAFELLGMIGDAGFVKLDVAEEHLRRGEWRDAASVAKEVVSLFVRAGVTVASVEALTFLRTAVEHEAATLPLVHYVREYIAADDPARSFAPPQ